MHNEQLIKRLTYVFKFPDTVSHTADCTECSQRQNSDILTLKTRPKIVGEPAVLEEGANAAFAREESADAVGALVAQVDDGVKGRTDSDVGRRLSDFSD